MKKPRPRGYYGPDRGKVSKDTKAMGKSRIRKETMGKIREYQWWKQGNTNAGKKEPIVKKEARPFAL